MGKRSSKVFIVTNEDDPHVDSLTPQLQALGAEVFRFDTEYFPTKIKINLQYTSGDLNGVIEWPTARANLFEFTSVWYRRPVRGKISNEITNPIYKKLANSETEQFLLQLWNVMFEKGVFFVSPWQSLEIGERKLGQLKVASKLGMRTPQTLVTNNIDEAKGFCKFLNNDVVVKHIRSTSFIDSGRRRLWLATKHLSAQHLKNVSYIKYAPSFLQENIHKKYDIRVTVIGKKVFAVKIDSQQYEDTKIDWRFAEHSESLKYEVIKLPQRVTNFCLQLVEYYKLAFGAIDLALSENDEYVFFEINPNGQFLWLDDKTDLQLGKEMAKFLIRGKM